MRGGLDAAATGLSLMTANVVHLHAQQMADTVGHELLNELAFDEFLRAEARKTVFDKQRSNAGKCLSVELRVVDAGLHACHDV